MRNVKQTLPVIVKGVSSQMTRLILRRWVCIEIVLCELVSNNPIEGTVAMVSWMLTGLLTKWAGFCKNIQCDVC